ncbi:hypothetical protein MMC08_007350 [Hypocenomyce scalaris]|nr:hypothetical protein [Hypocenomyce scalaris]
MAALDHSQTVVLITSNSEKTIKEFRSPRNTKYLVVPRVEVVAERDNAKDHQDAERDSDTPDPHIVPQPFLRISLDVPPKDISQGWVFGSDPARCDIILGEKKEGEKKESEDKEPGIRRVHFRINFNWDSRALILYNMSKQCTVLTDHIENTLILQKDHQRVLPERKTTPIEVGVFSMTAKLPSRNEEHEHAYERCWQHYRRQAEREPPGLSQLQVGSQSETTTPQIVRGPVSKGSYILGNVIGRGSFGVVCFATQNITGDVVAVKQFSTTQTTKDRGPDKEVALYKELSHVSTLLPLFLNWLTLGKDRIVRFIDAFIDLGGHPVIVMELLNLGNLSIQHMREAITVIENYDIVHQVLEALVYLHYKEIVHRDLKPDNILVQQRSHRIRIKVADFGVSTETGSEYLRSLCGTPIYCAPEMFSGKYRISVDIWAIGVVGLQYMKGLPSVPKTPNNQLDHAEWALQIRSLVEEESSGQYREFAEGLRHMLALNPKTRPTAMACLDNKWFRADQINHDLNEEVRGPPVVGFLKKQPVLQFGIAQRSWYGGDSTVLDTSEEHRQPSLEGGPVSKRPKLS